MPPRVDQVEVTLLGPGYGESAVIHLGNNHWIVVDSCFDSATGQPAAISYLENLGVDPETAVDFILATHWHDDHIGGMAALVSRCTHAKFCCSVALGNEEFIGYIRKYEARTLIAGGSGAREINQVISILVQRAQAPVAAISNKIVYRLGNTESGHGQECRIWTLSPSDQQIQKFLFGLSLLMPMKPATKRRCVSQRPNHLSVVLWIEIGELAILLGGDLEETGEANTGWRVIVSSAERPLGRAAVFKVPHHGAVSAHNESVWQEMLTEEPFAILTPWNLAGRNLPTVEDVDRIIELTPYTYSTANLRTPRAHPRSAPVMKTIREMGVRIRQAEPRTGVVQLRNGGAEDPQAWHLQLFQEACHLSEVLTTA